MNDYLQICETESKDNLDKLKNLNQEQDNVISQLNDIESILDGFLALQSDNNNNNSGFTRNSNTDLFSLQEEITRQVSDIQSNIDNLDNQVRIIYSDGETLKNKLDSIKNDNETEQITKILNEFYHSLQALKYYQNKVLIDIEDVDSKINSLKN